MLTLATVMQLARLGLHGLSALMLPVIMTLPYGCFAGAAGAEPPPSCRPA